jgi:choline dehydrogenase-like flavoprotein
MEDEFDALVVGSGLTGGIAAYALTNLGLTTLVLEAGPNLKGAKETYGTPVSNVFRRFRELWWTHKQKVQHWHPNYWVLNPDLFIDDKANPYTTPEGKPFYWIRGRQVGGRSHTWTGVCLRFSNYELMANAMDGKGTPWPVNYDDIAPFYDRVEKLLEVHGERDGIATLPDGQFLTPSMFTNAERHFQSAIKKNFGRSLVISRGIRAKYSVQPGDNFSRLSSNQTSLGQALQTGHLTLRSDTIASRLIKDRGRVSGIEYIDARTRETRQAKAKLIVLCPSTIETVRLLWNSEIGNSSGLLGRGLTVHIAKTLNFLFADLAEQDGFEFLGSDGIIIPRYANLFDIESSHVKDFTRGYGFMSGIGRSKFGHEQRMRTKQTLGFLTCMGEAVPTDSNRIMIDRGRTDAWGIPVAHIEYEWQKEDLAMSSRMLQDAHDMVKAAKGRPIEDMKGVKVPFVGKFIGRFFDLMRNRPPGLFVHEVGGARMGTKPENSVTNSFGQLWESPNVVLGDGSVFPSAGWQNPSLTEMALCLRAVENAVQSISFSA